MMSDSSKHASRLESVERMIADSNDRFAVIEASATALDHWQTYTAMTSERSFMRLLYLAIESDDILARCVETNAELERSLTEILLAATDPTGKAVH